MKSTNSLSRYFAFLLFLVFLTSCGNQQQAVTEEPITPPAQQQAAAPMPDFQKAPVALPVMYQSPTYMVDSDDEDELFSGDEASILKVGATIKSTRGPQPLWDILKRIASLKKMNVSWASDVDQNVLVDVDISANDDFYGAIDNLLRQVDYFHEMQGNTIVVKYKEVRQFRIAMPFVKSSYSTGTGGNVLGSGENSPNVDGTIQIKSEDNEFDIWGNIQENMDTIINLWNTEAVTPETVTDEVAEGTEAATDTPQQATRRVSSGGVAYLIDKPIGRITVTAPRPLLDELQRYFDSLTSELYKQISIEAKIIEVHLQDNSYLGINWTEVLKNKSLKGVVTFGAGADDPNGNYSSGQVWPYVSSNNNSFNDGTNHGGIYDPTRFISKITMLPMGFELFINALNEQGDTKILSNPKLSVMNGQPALISVGRNVTYIENVKSNISGSGVDRVTTYDTETARILSGISMALTATILDDNEVIMNLVPVTSELLEPIDYVFFGEEARVGLPIVNVREMSTTVRVKDGEMLVIGGLISEIDETEGEFAPIVGSIPLVRYLFGYEEKVKQKRELIILLKPRII